MKIRLKTRALLSSAVLAGVFTADPGHALAQSTTGVPVVETRPGTEAGSQTEVPEDQEIIVTARLRAEPLQETPVAVTAITGEQLTRQNVQDLSDIKSVPSVSIAATQTPGRAKIAIRGVSFTNTDPFQAPAIALIVDGIYYDSTSAAILNAFDLQAVEILRGPQGTLFGRNSPGGVINVRSRRPSGEFDVNAEVTLGNYELLDIRAGIDIPVVPDVINLRLAGMRRQNTDSPYTNLATTPIRFGRIGPFDYAGTSRLQSKLSNDLEVGQADTWLLRGVLEIKPANGLRITLTGEVLDDNSSQLVSKSTSFPPVPLGLVSPPGVPGGGDPRAGVNDISGKNPLKAQTFGGTIEYDFTDNLKLTSITGYRNEKLFNAFDIDSEFGAFLHSAQTWDTEQFTQEVRLQSDFGGRFDFILGGFFMDSTLAKIEESTLDRDLLCLAAFRVTNPGPPPGACPIGGFANVAPPNTPPVFAGPFVNKIVNFTDVRQQTKAYAVFSQLYFDVTDRLRLTVGGRYSWERKDFQVELYGGQFAGSVVKDQSRSWSNFAPMASVDYKVTDDILLYASYSQAYRSGGFLGRATTVASFETPFDQEKLSAYELGMKADFLNNDLRVNLTGFYSDYKNIQRELQVLVVAAENLVVNAASATIKGIELEVTARPFKGLELRGSAGYIDAGYGEFSPVLRPGQIPLTDLSLLATYPLPLTPEWTASGGISYTIPGGNDSEFNFGLNANFTSEQTTNTVPVPNGSDRRGDLLLVDGHVSWRSANDRLGLRLWVKNLTDKTYILGGDFGAGIVTNSTYAWPRTFGLTASFNYR